MNKIVGLFQPFSMEQKLYVFQDGIQKENQLVILDDVYTKLFELVEKYQIEQIDLSGPHSFIKGIKDKFQEEEILKYNANSVKIKII